MSELRKGEAILSHPMGYERKGRPGGLVRNQPLLDIIGGIPCI